MAAAPKGLAATRAAKITDPAPAMRRLVRRYQLDRVELVCSGGDVIARAYPSRHGAIVRQRYEAAVAAAGKTEFQIAELTELREQATEGQLTHAVGNTVTAALTALETELTGLG